MATTLALFTPNAAIAQFNFNFSSTGTVQPSIANQTCAGSGGMMGGGSCSEPFQQELTRINGIDYYHVIVGNGSGEFGIEYYIRTNNSSCWFGCASARVTGGMGGMGGGIAPLSASSGNQNNYADPLNKANSGTGRPDQTAIFMFNRTAEMTQEFLKATEARKPKITQSVNVAETRINFTMDMSAIAYNTNSTPGKLTLTQQVIGQNFPTQQRNPVTGTLLPDSGNFDVTKGGAGARPTITGGRYTYSPGSGDGGSLGSYTYFADRFDPYNVNWAQYCDPAQNPTTNCTTFGSIGGMGGGGMGGSTSGGMGGSTSSGSTSGGMGGSTSGGMSTTTVGSTTTTTLSSGGSSGGMMGGSSATTTTSAVTTTSTTAQSTTTTTTTSTLSSGGGGMMGGSSGTTTTTAAATTTTTTTTKLSTTTTTSTSTTTKSTTTTTTTTTASSGGGGMMGGGSSGTTTTSTTTTTTTTTATPTTTTTTRLSSTTTSTTTTTATPTTTTTTTTRLSSTTTATSTTTASTTTTTTTTTSGSGSMGGGSMGGMR